MPKIRGVHPDFWSDDDIVELSIPARLLFIGLWNYACDNGHLQDKPKQIKMRIFPGDDVSAAELLRELEASGRIKRGDGWITVPNLTKRQKPDVRYFTTCDKPGCDDPPEKVSQRAARRAHTVHTPGAQGVHDVGTPSAHGDGDGEGEVMVKSARKKRATTIPDDWQPNDAHRSTALEERVDCDREARQFRDSAKAKGRTYISWDSAFHNWLRSPYAVKVATPVADPSQLPPVENSWMRRR